MTPVLYLFFQFSGETYLGKNGIEPVFKAVYEIGIPNDDKSKSKAKESFAKIRQIAKSQEEETSQKRPKPKYRTNTEKSLNLIKKVVTSQKLFHGTRKPPTSKGKIFCKYTTIAEILCMVFYAMYLKKIKILYCVCVYEVLESKCNMFV